jgi:hypothetical protein
MDDDVETMRWLGRYDQSDPDRLALTSTGTMTSRPSRSAPGKADDSGARAAKQAEAMALAEAEQASKDGDIAASEANAHEAGPSLHR